MRTKENVIPKIRKGTHGPTVFRGESPITAHVKMSIRIPKGIVTSLTIKKNIIAIWLIYRTPQKPDKLDLDTLTSKSTNSILSYTIEQEQAVIEAISIMISDFVYEKIETWDKDTGKGLSDFITDLMIQDILEDDYSLYEFLNRMTK